MEELHLSEEEELEQFIDSMKPVDDRDTLDIVPRSQELDEDEKKLFTYFAKIPGNERTDRGSTDGCTGICR